MRRGELKMGEKEVKVNTYKKIVLKLIKEVEKLKKERDELRIEVLRFLDLYLKEKKEKEKLLNENIKLRML